MKNLMNSLLLILMLASMSACGSDYDALQDGNHRGKQEKNKPMVKTVRMSFGGDFISESEEPLQRAEDKKNTFVGINVTRIKKGNDIESNNTNIKKEPFAYGLYDRLSNISIDLVTGYYYFFEASILIEDQDKLWDQDASIYMQPFDNTNGEGFSISNMNKFDYTYLKDDLHKFSFKKLDSGNAYVDSKNALSSRYGQIKYPRVKRYYGKLDLFDPALISDVEILMDYKSFGIKFQVEKMPNNTKLTVSDGTNIAYKTPVDNPEEYIWFPNDLSLDMSTENSKTWEGIYSLNNFGKNSHDFTLKFCWDKGSGTKEYFSHKITVEAKKKKILKINIEGEVNQPTSGNIKFINVDETLTDDPDEINYTSK